MTISVSEGYWLVIAFGMIAGSILAISVCIGSIAYSMQKAANALAEMNEITNPEGLGEAFDGDDDDVADDKEKESEKR